MLRPTPCRKPKANIVQSQQDLAERKVYDNDTVFDEIDQWLNEQ